MAFPSFLLFLALLSPLQWAEGRDLYTTNAVCRTHRCVNPLFPGLRDLNFLDQLDDYTCLEFSSHRSLLSFCGEAVNYHFAVHPEATKELQGGLTEEARAEAGGKYGDILAADERALLAYTYHLEAIGLDAWDYREPWLESDSCVRSVWRLSCFTAFPKCERGVSVGDSSSYLPPCASSCSNYIKECGVECCDEGAQCVFEMEGKSKAEPIRRGYVDKGGPAPVCTGSGMSNASFVSAPFAAFLFCCHVFLGDSANRMARNPFVLAVVVALTTSSVFASIRADDMHAPDLLGLHRREFWRQQQSYDSTFSYVSPNGTHTRNSCSIPNLPMKQQCSGNGVCKPWREGGLGSVNKVVHFCSCHVGWADPECRTQRKSQAVAYTLSLFLGFTGADQYYLGFLGLGSLKLMTLGGAGLLWLLDIVRIGASPVYSNRHRTAADLPHWAFVLSSTSFFFLLGFLLVGTLTMRHLRQKQKAALLLSAEQEARESSLYPPYSITSHGAGTTNGDTQGHQQQHGSGPLPPLPAALREDIHG